MELNDVQSKLIEAKPGGPLLIKGVAGSGKTAIALHRALYLRERYCYSADDQILLVTYNRALRNYLEEMLNRLSAKYVSYYANIFSEQEKVVDVYTVNKLISDHYGYLKNESGLKPYYTYPGPKKYLKECIPRVKQKYSDVPLISHEKINFLMEEIDWMKSSNYVNKNLYQMIDRLGRAGFEGNNNPQRLIKYSKSREAVFALMEEFDRLVKESGKIYFKDMAIEVYAAAAKNPPRKYKHIIVDEGQDLSRVQLEYIITLYKNDQDSSFTFIADKAQSIYPHAWLVKGRSFVTLGIDMTGRSNTLNKNYRTSTQISQAAYSLIDDDPEITGCEDYVIPNLLDKQGYYPVLTEYQSARSEAVGLLSYIKKLRREGYSYRDMAIAARNKSQLDLINTVLKEQKIPCSRSNEKKYSLKKDHIQLRTLHAIKGLEYNIVFIAGLNSGVIPYYPDRDEETSAIRDTAERKLLYVGMTRARDRLYLSCSGKPSKFIAEINHKFLRLGLESKIKKFYQVQTDQYLFKDVISNFNSREEEVRQWVIRELIDTYGYPEQLIELEKEVQFGSRKGRVDIAVKTYNKETFQDSSYIFIETKAPGKDLNEAESQLKTYIKNDDTCEYGVVTNGEEFNIFNCDWISISDIPSFHRSMLPLGGNVYRYLDLKNNTTCTLKFDSEAPGRVMVIQSDYSEEEFSGTGTRSLPVYHRVAAGDAQVMQEEAEDTFCLPTRWYKPWKRMFLLKVKGDSMIKAGIDHDDLVVVEKRDSAENGDIAVVAFGDEARIKRYLQLKDKVVLISENDKYGAEEIKTDQARILGVAVGVIKNKI